jgi:O-antigen/teichoic acid export membrane protein
MKYRLVFEGPISKKKDISQVVRKLAAALKTDEKRIRKLFSGNPTVIRRDATFQSCKKLKSVFEKAGAICHIEAQEAAGINPDRSRSVGGPNPVPPPLPLRKDIQSDHPEGNTDHALEDDDQLVSDLDSIPDPDTPEPNFTTVSDETKALISQYTRKISDRLIDPEQLSSRGRDFTDRIKTYFLTVGEGAVELIINLVIMVMVERAYDQQGLGVYAYLLSLYFISGHLSEFGIPRYAEHGFAKHHDNRTAQIKILSDAHRSIFGLSLIFALLFFLTAGWDTDFTRIGEMAAAYLIIGATLPLRNLNRLKLAVLHGLGRHEAVAKLRMIKRFIFLGVMFVMLIIHIAPSLLFTAFLVSEIALKLLAARKYKLAKIKQSWQRFIPRRDTLSEGYRYIFTDEALDIVLYLDFFILGMFVSSWELGVYAEASILARFLLLIPVSIKPIFRRQYCLLAERRALQQASNLFQRTTRIMFYIQALLALYMLLYFPELLNAFFHVRGEELFSYRIFSVIVPGLIFFAAITSQEPVYEAAEQVSDLKKLIFIVTLVNAGLNIYLVPFAGVFGAAVATMISMLVYFLVFDRCLTGSLRIRKFSYLFAGAGVYLLYLLMRASDFRVVISLLLIPAGLFAMLLAMGFFYIEDS